MGRQGRGWGVRRGGAPAHGRSGGSHGSDWLYGRRPVIEALRAGRRRFDELRVSATAREDCSDEELAEIESLASAAGLRAAPTDRRELTQLLGPVNHQGVALKTGPYPYADLEDILDAAGEDGNSTILFLDHIEDPQNLGSLLRSAEAAGVAGVVIPEDRAAEVTPAAARASAGAAEAILVAKVVNLVRAIEKAKEAGFWITGLDFGEDARDYADIDYRGRVGIIVGNEGRGVSRLVREQCDFIATLPMLGSVDSLNAAVSGAIVIYEALRQRRATKGE